jgi:flagellar hook protein FlgE
MVGLDSALQGLVRSQSSFDQAAGKIAQEPLSLEHQNPQEPASLADDMVALMLARNNYEANLKTVQTGSEMQKKLLDLLA